ncbi:hypothetical protein QQ020_33895 [Fulvivirgaceae bacterium BMA12]|uniref:HTH luxR-type domain-containing protein n=1 Tax=Agaribacillus aureus TaxID=3051825 RepID=A0ABT8LH33_9BACT|nr:hypothetical protein [Fulvivirgaceae bacterium BMA12]
MSSKYLQEANRLKFQNPDSSMSLFKLSYNYHIKRGDTVKAIRDLINLSYLFANNALFSQSYDGYWQALLLADKMADEAARAWVYNGLGWLYSIYKRQEKAIGYFNLSQSINKQLDISDELNRQIRVNNYYALATLYRKEMNTHMSRRYLDSCWLVQELTGVRPRGRGDNYFNAETGYVLYLETKYEEALNLLLPLEEKFGKHDPSYLVIYYTFLGHIYKSLGNFSLSELYYLRALENTDRYKSHLDLKSGIYDSLSNLYILKGQFAKAYQNLKESKILNEKHFGSRSEDNKYLLEIKDDYRREKEKQHNLIKEQRLAKLEHEDRVWYLKSIILTGTILFLLLLGTLLYRYLRSAYKAEKRLLQKHRELEIKKTNEVLEIKNKELTASALQAIEREELLLDLKRKLIRQQRRPDPQEIGKIVKNIGMSTSKNWKEFEARFTAVNESFYIHLNNRFPGLSQGEQRTCALIKLNFSCKEMAKLLGISIESAHTTRHRLRKKLGLNRSTNLEEFIAGLEHQTA